MDYFDKARDLYNQAVKAVSKTETEKKLAEALSNANWGASTTLLREIANLTFDYQEYSVVMREVWQTLQQPPRYWRQIFKALTLLEYLIKNGAERVVQEAQDRVHMVRALSGFSFYHEGGEKGAGVREKAKALGELLADNERIKEEREKASALRDKYTGIGRDGMTRRPTSSMGGMGSGSTFPSNGMGSGGIGRYNDDPVSNDFGGSDDELKEKKKKKKKDKKDKKKKKDKHLSDDEDEDDGDDMFGRFEDEPSGRAKSGSVPKDDDFGDFGGFGGDDSGFGDFEEAGSKKKDKKKKEKKKKKKSTSDDEEDLFGDSIGGPELSSNEQTFDPFGGSAAPVAAPAAPKPPSVSGGDDDFGFGAFEGSSSQTQSFAPTKQAQTSDDPFASFSAPAPRMQPVQQMQMQPNQGAAMDFFGNPAQSMPPMSAPQQYQQGGQMQYGMPQQQSQVGRPMPMMQPQQPQHNPSSSSNNGSSSDPWAGLVNLGNLSLNDGNKTGGANKGAARRLSSTSTTSNSSFGMMGGQSHMQQPQQPMMMQPQQQQQQFFHQQQQQQQHPPQQQQQQKDDFDLLF